MWASTKSWQTPCRFGEGLGGGCTTCGHSAFQKAGISRCSAKPRPRVRFPQHARPGLKNVSSPKSAIGPHRAANIRAKPPGKCKPANGHLDLSLASSAPCEHGRIQPKAIEGSLRRSASTLLLSERDHDVSLSRSSSEAISVNLFWPKESFRVAAHCRFLGDYQCCRPQ